MASPWKTFSTVGVVGAVLLLLGADGDGCGGGTDTEPEPVDTPPGTSVRLDFAAKSDFYAAPFPSEHRRNADGRIDLGDFPNPGDIGLVKQIVDVVAADADGFGTTSGVFFSLTDPIDPASLPDVNTSLSSLAPVFLASVDPDAPDLGTHYPVRVGFVADGGPFGAPNLLTLLPYQGIPLRPGTLYAAVVTRNVLDAKGKQLDAGREVATLASGITPDGMSPAAAADYRAALVQLEAAGVKPGDIAGLSVFRTGQPTATFEKVKDAALANALPAIEKPFTPGEVFDDFCVYQTTIKIPTYQAGVPPYDEEGGGWAFDAAGNPVVQAEEEANFVVTLPRGPMPKDGFPVVVFSRTGAGGERPLVDRGVRDGDGVQIEPGTGPAREFAKVGFGGSSIDGPHGGLRNVSGQDEQFLVFNVFNPLALRDNVRQSALELVLQAHILEGVQIDAAACPGLTTPDGAPARFDVKTMATFGHSMGASIVPLALAFEPRLRAAILSGAGSSYIDNILFKKKPIATKGVAELVLEYTSEKRELSELDPVMSLLQWAAEPADTQAYARSILREPVAGAVHHVMMVEGVVDNYILPPIANATVLSLGLDLAGQELTGELPELASFDTLTSVIGLGKREAIAFPAQGNVSHKSGSASTAVVVQHAEDGVEDGHEAAFQTEPPKHQYRCFLQSFAKGTPRVPQGAASDAPCD